jgi:hypothetical protein
MRLIAVLTSTVLILRPRIMYMGTENFVRTVTVPPTFDAGVVHFYLRTEHTTSYVSYCIVLALCFCLYIRNILARVHLAILRNDVTIGLNLILKAY